MKPIIIIPAYNPDENLITLVNKLHEMNFKTVIINDGSKKESLWVFELLNNKNNCEICHHTENKGKGAALKTGIQYTVKNHPKFFGCITADADGQHSPEDILKIAESMEKNPNVLVLGSRDFTCDNIPFKSKWGNRITSFVFYLFTGKRCADTQTGLRGIPKNLIKISLAVPGNKYEYEMNFLMTMARNEDFFCNVPINTIYLENNKSSHFHPIKDSMRIYFAIIKFSIPILQRENKARSVSYR